MNKIYNIIRKTTIILIIISFFVNLFSNLPFNKIIASIKKEEGNEEILNEEYLEEEITPLFEAQALRTENTKTYKNSDGSLSYYYYNNKIHELTDNGYQEIDSSFKEDSSDFKSEQLNYKVSIPKKIHENKKIKLQYENTKIEITYNKINKVEGKNNQNTTSDNSDLTRLTGNLLYENIYEHVDLELVSTSTTLKENIILNKYITDFSFTYNIKLTNLQIYEENSIIYFINSNKDIIYQIEPYYMIDRIGNSSYDITIKLEQLTGDEYQIEVTPSDSWLNLATYPVTIDPIITYTQTTTSNKIEIKEFMKTASYSAQANNVKIIKYIEDYIQSETGEHIKNDYSRYSIMKVDISDLPKEVMYISSKLYMYEKQGTLDSEIVTLNEIISNIPFDTINGTTNYSKRFIANQQKESALYRYSFNILDAVIRNLNDGEIIFEFSPLSFSTNDIEVAFEGNTSSSYRPYFSFRYTEVNGLKDYWTYHSINASSDTTIYINDYMGNLVVENKDYINTSEVSSFNISHYYNSTSKSTNIGYGNGWRLNYSEIMEEFSSNYYKYTDGTGHVSYYRYQRILNEEIPESGLYINEEGEDSQIEIGTSYTDFYRRVVDNENIYKYNWERELIYIVDSTNPTYNYININYTELESGLRVISLIEDSFDNQAIFTYENDLLTKLIIKKQKYDGNQIAKDEKEERIYEVATTIKYEYDEEGNLIESIKYAKDTEEVISRTHYTYNNNNLVSQVGEIKRSSSNDCTILINYNNNNKVSSYTSSKYEIEETTPLPYNKITYGTRKTTFTDIYDSSITYLFDKYGHTINVIDSQGYAQFYKYESENTNSYLNNKMISSSDTIYTGYNMIENHGFENTTSNAWSYINDTTKIGLDTTNIAYGTKALRITNEVVTSSPYATQTIKLTGGTTYTIFGFIKTIALAGYKEHGGYIDITSDENVTTVINQTYNTPKDEYTEYYLEFRVDGDKYTTYNIKINLKTSYGTTSYFDNIQLLNAVNDSRYNLLTNPSFEDGTTGWTNITSIQKEPSKIYGNYEGYIEKGKTITQQINIKLNSEDTISFGGFIRTNNNDVKIRIRFYNIEKDTLSSYYTISYLKDINDYQYLIESITIDDTYHQIIFEVVNEGTSGIYVDNLILQNDIYTNKYEYNSYGKTTKIISGDKETIITRTDGRNISQIKYDKIYIDINENITDVTYNQNTVNIDGSINNIKTTTYTYKQGGVAETIVGSIDTGYFVTSTNYTSGYQYISSTTDEFNQTTTYDIDYLTGLIKSITSPNGTTTTYTYDIYERIISQNIGSRTITYTYNEEDQISTITLGDDTSYIKYLFTYTKTKDISEIYLTSNDKTTTLVARYEYLLYNKTYDGSSTQDLRYTGLISKITYNDASYIRYEYDEKFNLTKIYKKQPNKEETLVEKYIYNEQNQISYYQDNNTNISYYYNYDLKGRITLQIDTANNKIEYFYNELDNISKIKYTVEGIEGTIYYSYDEEGNLLSMNDNNIITTLYYNNDVLGRLQEKITTLVEYTNLKHKYTYYTSDTMNKTEIETNNLNKLTSTRIAKEEITIYNTKYIYEYNYDSIGNIIKITLTEIENTLINKKQTYHYEYNQYNQLTKEIVKNININEDTETQILNTTYTYDTLGNIITINRSIKQDIYESLPTNITYNYNETNNKTKLTSYTIDGITYSVTYNQTGDITNYNGYDLEYENGRLVAVKENN